MEIAGYINTDLNRNNDIWEEIQLDFKPSPGSSCLLLADLRDYEPEAFFRMTGILDKGERDKARDFISLQSKRQFILGRYLVRRIAGNHFGIEPGGVNIALSGLQKPRIINDGTPFFFNISHAGNKVLIGISTDDEIGVDIEYAESAFDYQSFANEHFSEDEKEWMEGSPVDSMRIFFSIWTRKEAWLKLTGEGLHDNLRLLNVCREKEEKGGQVYISSFKIRDYELSVAMFRKTEIIPYMVRDNDL